MKHEIVSNALISCSFRKSELEIEKVMTKLEEISVSLETAINNQIGLKRVLNAITDLVQIFCSNLNAVKDEEKIELQIHLNGDKSADFYISYYIDHLSKEELVNQIQLINKLNLYQAKSALANGSLDKDNVDFVSNSVINAKDFFYLRTIIPSRFYFTIDNESSERLNVDLIFFKSLMVLLHE